jgi:hypothetical protein
MLKLPDTIRVSEAPGMLPLARVVLIHPDGGMAGVRPALGESIVVAGHIALDVIALPARDVRLPAPKARQERCEGQPRRKKHDKMDEPVRLELVVVVQHIGYVVLAKSMVRSR